MAAYMQHDTIFNSMQPIKQWTFKGKVVLTSKFKKRVYLLKSQDNKAILKRLMLVKSTILHSKLFFPLDHRSNLVIVFCVGLHEGLSSRRQNTAAGLES